MKIGFNLLLWTGFVTEEIYPTIEAIKKTGYDGVEIPLFDGDPAHYQKLGQFLKDTGLKSTAVTVIPSEETNLLSDDATVREAGLKHVKWAIDCCEAMGAETLLGPYHQPLGIFSGAGTTEQEFANAAQMHKQAAEYASGKTVLALESLNRFECYFLNTMADAKKYVQLVDHPNFGTMFDTFHANIEEKCPVTALKENFDVVRHVHISENDRGTPGDGHTPIKETLNFLKEQNYQEWAVIEAFGRALPDLAAATRVWRDFFPSREYVFEQGYKYIQECLG